MFGDSRGRALAFFLDAAGEELDGPRTCVDIACGTGMTALWLAAKCPRLRVIGIDSSRQMLRLARRRARMLGLADRCSFVLGDAAAITPERLQAAVPSWSGRADVVTCSLGFSVIAGWQEAFRNTLDLLRDDGIYMIYDQYIPGAVFSDYSADTSRRSWELVERGFLTAETRWFGTEFIAIGHGKRQH